MYRTLQDLPGSSITPSDLPYPITSALQTTNRTEQTEPSVVTGAPLHPLLNTPQNIPKNHFLYQILKN